MIDNSPSVGIAHTLSLAHKLDDHRIWLGDFIIMGY